VVQLHEYIGGLRGEAGDLRFQKSQLVKNGARSWSRWGSEPFAETTDCWRNELERRAAELDRIAGALEKGQMV
jgi:hypothetical protein